MGLFGRLFGDPEKDLERAQTLLAKGEAARALELAARAGAALSGVAGRRAETVLEQAREAVVEEALARASRAEESEYFGDAAEWLQSALEHVDGSRRAALEARIESLLAKDRELQAGDPFDPGLAGDGAAEMHEAAVEPDADNHFLALVGMLVDDVADRYERQPPEFRAAYVDLHQGRLETARTALETLAADHPADPVVLLELGRCRLVSGDAAGASSDFETVWETWGDEPLDLAGASSVPSLWAEAQLARGEAEPVVERLAELADPSRHRADLAQPYAVALLDSGRLDEAARYLTTVAARFPSEQDLPFLLAQALGRRGDRQGAIACLEAAIAPSCATGSCRKPPKHLPSLRALTGLYLEEGEELGRARELLTHLAQAQGGRLASEDHLLLARYHELTGHPEAAEEARSEARRLHGELTAAAAASS